MIAGFKTEDGRWIGLDNNDYDWGWKQPFVQSIKSYEQNGSQHEGDYRVSDIVRAPRQYCLDRRHKYYVEPTKMLSLWKGSVLHKALSDCDSQADDILTETSVCAKIHGAHLCGKPDRFNKQSGHLVDYKFTKCGTYTALMKNIETSQEIDLYHEYVKSMWTYRFLLQSNGYTVNKVSLLLELSDWSPSSWKSQPPSQLMEIELPVPDEYFETWLFDKVETLMLFKSRQDSGLPTCSDTQKWVNNKGVPLRCNHYCNVSEFCEAINKCETFDWEKGYNVCKKRYDKVDDVLLQCFDTADPSTLKFRFQWIEIFKYIKENHNQIEQES